MRGLFVSMMEMILQGFFIQMQANQQQLDELSMNALKFIGGEFNKRQKIWEQHIEAAEHQVQQNSAALLSCLLRTYVIEECLLNKGIAKDKDECRNVNRIPRDELSTVLDLFGWGIEDFNKLAKQAKQMM